MLDWERYERVDEGCDLFSSCLNCPLPRCRYDEPGRRQKGKELRNMEIVRLRSQGMGIKELAQLFRVTKRTIHRVIGREL